VAHILAIFCKDCDTIGEQLPYRTHALIKWKAKTLDEKQSEIPRTSKKGSALWSAKSRAEGEQIESNTNQFKENDNENNTSVRASEASEANQFKENDNENNTSVRASEASEASEAKRNFKNLHSELYYNLYSI